MPDSVRGIQAAIDHSWLDPDPDSETTTGLVELLARVLAWGSIAINAFVLAATTARRAESDEIREAFDRVGVGSLVRHGDAEGRATEIIPE